MTPGLPFIVKKKEDENKKQKTIKKQKKKEKFQVFSSCSFDNHGSQGQLVMDVAGRFPIIQ